MEGGHGRLLWCKTESGTCAESYISFFEKSNPSSEVKKVFNDMFYHTKSPGGIPQKT